MSDSYSPTESKYKGGADEKYITYDLEQSTRGDNTAMYPKVKRVYVSGDVTGTEIGTFAKESGKEVFGMRIAYERTRAGYERSGYKATRSDTGTTYEVPPTMVEGSSETFERIEELPEDAKNIAFHDSDLPERYERALQDVK
ncbi:MAG: hypothetical protein R3A46_00925 [Thermomicrobiales bacterium]